MKRICLFILCSLPVFAFAQSWSLMAEGGGLWNSRTSRSNSFDHHSPLRGTGAVGFSYTTTSGWEAGIRAGYRAFAFIQKRNLRFEDEFDPLTGQIKPGVSAYRERVESFPAWTVAPFVSRYFRCGRMDFHAGLAPVFLRFKESVEAGFSGFPADRTKGDNGYGAEALAGAAFRFSAGFSLYAEWTGGIMNVPSFRERATMYTASLSLGAKVRIR